MISVHTKEEAFNLDRILQDEYGYEPILLMENAAQTFVNLIKDKLKGRVCILCGTGNNGGDGLAVARILQSEYDVTVFYIGNKENASKSNLINLNIFEKLNGKVIETNINNIKELSCSFDIIIDAVYGIGFKNELDELSSYTFNQVNQSNSLRIAIDIPSGLYADYFQFSKHTFKADLTVSMFGYKSVFANKESAKFTGEVLISRLNVPQEIIDTYSNLFLLEQQDIKKIIPIRRTNSSKFDYGSVLFLCGSMEMQGAAIMASKACINSGAGLVYSLGTTEIELSPEIIKLITTDYIFENLESQYPEQIQKSSVIAIGSGIGKQSSIKESLPYILEKYKDKSFVLDADALFHNDYVYNSKTVLTPHIFEFARMLDKPVQDIENNKLNLAKDYAQKYNCILLLKGATTIITDGIITFYNLTGNPGMATAGSGDVLTGIISALLALGISPLLAAALGAYLHGLAGDRFVEKFNTETLTALSIIEELKYVI